MRKCCHSFSFSFINCFSIVSVVGTFLNAEGSALYGRQRLLNHSCEPNASPHFPHSDFTLSLRAERAIQPNEEICISYLDECLRDRSRHTRHKVLRSVQYGCSFSFFQLFFEVTEVSFVKLTTLIVPSEEIVTFSIQ